MRKNVLSNIRGQSTLEFAVIIACVVAALLAMRPYIQRAMQGRLRGAADDIGQQYDPKNTWTDAGKPMTIEQSSNVTTTVESEEDGKKSTTTVNIESETERRYGTEIVGALQ